MNNAELREELFAVKSKSTRYALTQNTPKSLNGADVTFDNIIEIIIVNEGSGNVYVLYGKPADVTATNYTWIVKPDETLVLDKYRGEVSVVTDDRLGANIQTTISRNKYI